MEFTQVSAEYWASSVRLNNALTLVAYTILYYDYLLTVFAEIEYFWRSINLSIVSVLYVITRYYGFLGPIPLAFEYFADLSQHLQVYHQAFAISSQGIVAVMLVIRTYALYERSKRILAVLIVTHLGGAIGCFIAVVTSQSPVHTSITLPFTITGCNLSLTNAQSIHLALAWGAMLWFDTTIFVLTVLRTLRMRHHFSGGLLEMMLRDGSVYFGIMVASNVSNIITFMVTPSGTPLKGMETTLTNVLSTTLTSRLILNLRDPELRQRRRTAEPNPTSMWTSTVVPPATSHLASTRYTLTQIETGVIDTQMTGNEERIPDSEA